MSAESLDSGKKIKSEILGFNLTESSKNKVKFMAKWFKKKNMIEEETIAAAARKCIEIGWAIVSQVTEAEANKQVVNYVQITLSNLQLPTPYTQNEEE